MKYINKLKSEDLIDFLNVNGLFVLDDIDEIRAELGQSDTDTYYIRCQSNIDKEKNRELTKYISRNRLMSTIFEMSEYYSLKGRNIYAIDDFMIRRAFTLDEQEVTDEDIALQRNYHRFMCDKFKNSEYLLDYDRFVESLNAEEVEKDR